MCLRFSTGQGKLSFHRKLKPLITYLLVREDNEDARDVRQFLELVTYRRLPRTFEFHFLETFRLQFLLSNYLKIYLLYLHMYISNNLFTTH